jgi:hypothetical protein
MFVETSWGGVNVIEASLKRKKGLRHPVHQLEGWIERVDLSKRRLHVRTGSRDKYGVCVLIPDDCPIHHQRYHLQLSSLLPCDAICIDYEEDENGARIAQKIEMIAG